MCVPVTTFPVTLLLLSVHKCPVLFKAIVSCCDVFAPHEFRNGPVIQIRKQKISNVEY